MWRNATFAATIAAAVLVGGRGKLTSQGPNDVIALERSALERWGKGDVNGFLSIYAHDITYYDPFTDRRIDGFAAMRAYLEPFAGKIKVDRFEILNAKVQGTRDIAVLTYNIQNYGRQPDGTERPTTRWNVTEVFRRADGKWRTIHSHFSFTKPDIRPPTEQEL